MDVPSADWGCDGVTRSTTSGVVLAWNRNVALWALNKYILNHNN